VVLFRNLAEDGRFLYVGHNLDAAWGQVCLEKLGNNGRAPVVGCGE
jgi:hypothetical protein